MRDKITILYYALWIAHPIFQTAIAIAIWRRGRQQQFKFFFAYIVTQILTFAIVFPNRNHPATAFYASWISTGVSVVLGFKVIHEAFLDAFRPFHTLRDLGTVLFKWAGLVMLLVAGVVSVSTNSQELAPWMEAILTTQRCVRIIQVGMVLFLLFFARYLGVSRRQYSFGIALGFGCFAIVELSLVASWVGDHLGGASTNLLNMIAYNCALLVWLGYTMIKSPARDASASLLRPQRWEQSLADIQHPAHGDSLIPMFEDMVDRALSRTQVTNPLPAEEGMVPKTAAAHAGTSSSAGLGSAGISGSQGRMNQR